MPEPRTAHRETIGEKLDRIDTPFVEKGAARVRRRDVDALLRRATELAKAFAVEGPLRRYKSEAREMQALVADFQSGDYLDGSYHTAAVCAYALAYVLDPNDVIHDVVPIAGKMDDAVVMRLALDLVGGDLDAHRKWRRDRPAEA